MKMGLKNKTKVNRINMHNNTVHGINGITINVVIVF